MAFDAIDHWLPLPSLVGFRDIHRDLTQGNPVSGLTLAAETTDDDADHAMPRDPNFYDIDATHISAPDNEDDSFTPDDSPSPILLSTIVMAQAHPDTAFDAIDHWLPLTSLTGSCDIHRDLIQGNPISVTTLAADATDDDADHAMPHDPNFYDIDTTHLSAPDHKGDSFTSSDSPSPMTTLTPLSPLKPIMDICTIITQNVHGLWCRSRNGDGSIIPNCECDMTKLEYLVYRMHCDDIDAWLIQETWLEDDDFDTNIGGYHIFRTNSPIGETGRNHLFRGVTIILLPRFYQAWKSVGSPTPITTDTSGAFAGRFIGLPLKLTAVITVDEKSKGNHSAYVWCLHTIPATTFPTTTSTEYSHHSYTNYRAIHTSL